MNQQHFQLTTQHLPNAWIKKTLVYSVNNLLTEQAQSQQEKRDRRIYAKHKVCSCLSFSQIESD